MALFFKKQLPVLKQALLFFPALTLSVFFSTAKAQNMADYTAYPVIAEKALPPAIVIILDNSTSMAEGFAYSGAFHNENAYYGYFNAHARYDYSQGQFAIKQDGPWSGNFLNWLTMRRIDIAKKVLIGGQAESRQGSGVNILTGDSSTSALTFTKYTSDQSLYCPYNGQYGFVVQDGYFWVGRIENKLIQHEVARFNIRVKKEIDLEPGEFGSDGNVAGIIQNLAKHARIGLEVFNANGSAFEYGGLDNKDGGKIIQSTASPVQETVQTIERIQPSTFSPLSEALYQGVRYFMQSEPAWGQEDDFNVNEQANPFFFSYAKEEAACMKSFIILVTDGYPTFDLNIPAFLKDYDNDNDDAAITPMQGSTFLDDIALWAHTIDINPRLEGKQPLTLFVIPCADDDHYLTMNSARNGGFVDGNDNNIPDDKSEWDSDDNGVPDNYSKPQDCSQIVRKIFSETIALRNQMFSVQKPAVITTSPKGEGMIFQSFFKPSIVEDQREVNWIGFLYAFWLDPYGNIREDSKPDGKLILTDDNIIEFASEPGTATTIIKRFNDEDGDGQKDHILPDEVITFAMLKPLWEAGTQLAKMDASERSIFTSIDGQQINFVASYADMLQPYLRAKDKEEAVRLIDFIRGQQVPGLRPRSVIVDEKQQVWKLGDIIHSAPVVTAKPSNRFDLIYGDASYKNFYVTYLERNLTVFVGANDGMLHAFYGGKPTGGDNPESIDRESCWIKKEDLGRELWAYIPANLLPHLKWLSLKGYTHTYFVDSTPQISDARIFSPDALHPDGWGTVLVGGMGFGGKPIKLTDSSGEKTLQSSYFAIDITVPSKPVLLWEKTFKNMGLTTSQPCIGRIGEFKGIQGRSSKSLKSLDGIKRWYVVVGSGPTDYDGSSTQKGRIFILDLSSGEMLTTLEDGPLGNSRAFLGSPIGIDMNLNYSVDTYYIGQTFQDSAGQMHGRMLRLSTTSCTNAGQNCRDPDYMLYETNPANWKLSSLIEIDRPITAQPAASFDRKNDFYVYFGTGKYVSREDSSDFSLNSFYGVKDPCYHPGCNDTVSSSDFFNATDVTIFSSKADTAAVRGASVDKWNELVGLAEDSHGWVLNLKKQGERIIEKPVVFAGMVFFTSFIPENNLCIFSGKGTLYAVYYKTGTSYKSSVIGREKLGDEFFITNALSLGLGFAFSPGIHTGMGDDCNIFINQSTSSIRRIHSKPPLRFKSGLLEWKCPGRKKKEK